MSGIEGFQSVTLRELNEVWIGLGVQKSQDSGLGKAVKQLLDTMIAKKQQTSMLPTELARDFKEISVLYRLHKAGDRR